MQPTSEPVSEPRDERSAARRAYRGALFVVLIVFAAYAATIPTGFFTIDDQALLVDSPATKAPWSDAVVLAFDPGSDLNRAMKAYRPLMVLALRFDVAMFGVHPYGHHLGNVLLFSALCGWLYLLLRGFTSGTVSLLATLMFAFHPVHVESVAWIAARGDHLAALLWVATCLAFHRAHSQRSGWMVASGILFVLAYLAKPVSLALVPILFAWDLFLQHRPLAEAGKRIAPFAVLGAAAVFFMLWTSDGVGKPAVELTVLQRIGYAILLLARYGATAVSPVYLSYYYEPFPPLRGVLSELLAGGMLICATPLLLLRYQRAGAWFLAVLFLAPLVPVLQLVPFTIMQADRYLYVPVLATSLAAALAVDRLRYVRLKHALSLLLVVASCGLTAQRIWIWQQPSRVWQDAVDQSGGALFARMQLARALLLEGRPVEALAHSEVVYQRTNGWPRAARVHVEVLLALRKIEEAHAIHCRVSVEARASHLTRWFEERGSSCL